MMNRDELLARLNTILSRDCGEDAAILLRTVEVLTGPRCRGCEKPASVSADGLCVSCETFDREQENAEHAAEMAAEMAAERYFEDRCEQRDEYEPPDTDIFDGMDGE